MRNFSSLNAVSVAGTKGNLLLVRHLLKAVWVKLIKKKAFGKNVKKKCFC